MSSDLRRRHRQMVRKPVLMATLCVGFGIALGALGMQLRAATGAPPSRQAAASARPALTMPTAQAAPSRTSDPVAVDANDLESVQRSIASYER